MGVNAGTYYGAPAVRLLEALTNQGVGRIALLARHSVREFNRDVHDLVNPLTPEGREHCGHMGRALPKSLQVRGYASPPERCVETATLVMRAHGEAGGQAGSVRPVESLGVFYALDQIKMWKALQLAGGLSQFVTRWVDDRVAPDAMIPADQAARLIARSALSRLRSGADNDHLDLCVTHDMTILLLKDRLLREPAVENTVDFLEAVALFEADGDVWMQSCQGEPVAITGLVT